MSEKSFQYTIRSDTVYLKSLSDFVVNTLQNISIDINTTDDLIIAVDEIATNIILHAYKNDSSGYIRTEIILKPDRIIVKLFHKGGAFDPASINKPDFSPPLHLREQGGMGLYIINRFMDQVQYDFMDKDHDENTITLEKKLKRQ